MGVRIGSGKWPHRILFSCSSTTHIPNLNPLRVSENALETLQDSSFWAKTQTIMCIIFGTGRWKIENPFPHHQCWPLGVVDLGIWPTLMLGEGVAKKHEFSIFKKKLNFSKKKLKKLISRIWVPRTQDNYIFTQHWFWGAGSAITHIIVIFLFS